MPEAPEQLLTVKEYAALFRKHPGSVYRAIRQGTFKRPVEYDGRSLLIRVSTALLARIRPEPVNTSQHL